MNTIKDLVQKSEEFDMGKLDYKCLARKDLFSGGKFLIEQVGGMIYPHDVEEHALNQIAARLDIPPGYLRRCPPAVQDVNLNHWLGDLQEKAKTSRRISPEIFVRTYGDNVRAFLTDSYEPIDNTAMLKAVDELMPEGTPYKLIKPLIERDDIYVRLTILDNVGPGGNYGFGAYFHNGETGSRGICVAPFLMRTSCTNSTLWLEHAFRVPHVVSYKHSEGWLMANIKEALGRSFRLGDKMIENVVKAEAEKIPNLNKVIAELATKYKMTSEESRAVSMGTENQQTRMGLVNGLTYMAQMQEKQDDRIRYEALAGAILAEPWSLFGNAAKKAQQAVLAL